MASFLFIVYTSRLREKGEGVGMWEYQEAKGEGGEGLKGMANE